MIELWNRYLHDPTVFVEYTFCGGLILVFVACALRSAWVELLKKAGW